MNFAFTKYHALGNDYIVINPKDLSAPLTTEQVKTICHRNFGVGSDGILLGPLPSTTAKCALKIYNPDGSIAEKSGNGVRIFSRYLWDTKFVGNDEFALQTDGGIVRSTVFDNGKMARVEMGHVSFDSEKIPVTGDKRDPQVPEVPTLKESGVDMVATAWFVTRRPAIGAALSNAENGFCTPTAQPESPGGAPNASMSPPRLINSAGTFGCCLRTASAAFAMMKPLPIEFRFSG